MGGNDGGELLLLGDGGVVAVQIGDVLEEVDHHVSAGDGRVLGDVVRDLDQLQLIAGGGKVFLDEADDLRVWAGRGDDGQRLGHGAAGEGEREHQQSGKQFLHGDSSF